eukprot:TRINITY_DN56637_c0_g1_i1.p1 TRINITY_DN56637_c0_g1~~TRINITY_DN56637_c0_g1_i1.p1  ORF type:complete len:481 (-),score=111.42 TRINITY_DN56637_c0_g1_i1:499-1941(-)
MAMNYCIADSFEDNSQLLINAASAAAVAAATLHLVPHDAALAAAAGVRHALDDADAADVVTAVAAAAAAAFGSATPSHGGGRAAWAAAVGAAYGRAAHFVQPGDSSSSSTVHLKRVRGSLAHGGGFDDKAPSAGDDEADEEEDAVATQVIAAVAAAAVANMKTAQDEVAAAQASPVTQAASMATAAAEDLTASAVQEAMAVPAVATTRCDADTTRGATASWDGTESTTLQTAAVCEIGSPALVASNADIAVVPRIQPSAASQVPVADHGRIVDQYVVDTALATGKGKGVGAVAATATMGLSTLSDLQPGSLGQICGLRKLPNFNGLTVKCEEYCADKGAWLVVLDFGADKTKIYLKDHNIKPFKSTEAEEESDRSGSDTSVVENSWHIGEEAGAPVAGYGALVKEETGNEEGKRQVAANAGRRCDSGFRRSSIRGRGSPGCGREPGRVSCYATLGRRRRQGKSFSLPACGDEVVCVSGVA